MTDCLRIGRLKMSSLLAITGWVSCVVDIVDVDVDVVDDGDHQVDALTTLTNSGHQSPSVR